ncbi:MAG: glycosyltransferase, partial [Acidobacteria bacterium]|nr:glycosyltransferase [Acidobacteriota bacterium]
MSSTDPTKLSQPGDDAVELSVVFPVYNEEDAVGQLLEEIRGALEPLGAAYEVVAVDDKSKDGTLEILKQAAALDSRLRILESAENRGQAAALYTGL